MDWSAGQYLKFEDERTRPARNLLAEVPLASPRLCVDLGCGPGNSTELIAARYPDARVVGVDTAPDMLRAARERLPGATFVDADVATWQPDAPADLLFANAVFQWVPGHLAVLERLMGNLAPGGVLAVQMPDNLGEPSHLLMEETACSPEFADAFSGKTIRRTPLPAARTYVERLVPLAARVEVWHTIYQHRLADAAAIVEWVKGTGLRPYLAPLPQERRGIFIEAYTARIAEAYPPLAAGGVLLAFPRLFIMAVKAES